VVAVSFIDRTKLEGLFLRLYALCVRATDDLTAIDNPYFTAEQRACFLPAPAEWSSEDTSSRTSCATMSKPSNSARTHSTARIEHEETKVVPSRRDESSSTGAAIQAHDANHGQQMLLVTTPPPHLNAASAIARHYRPWTDDTATSRDGASEGGGSDDGGGGGLRGGRFRLSSERASADATPAPFINALAAAANGTEVSATIPPLESPQHHDRAQRRPAESPRGAPRTAAHLPSNVARVPVVRDSQEYPIEGTQQQQHQVATEGKGGSGHVITFWLPRYGATNGPSSPEPAKMMQPADDEEEEGAASGKLESYKCDT
jgi:hypothetical protein